MNEDRPEFDDDPIGKKKRRLSFFFFLLFYLIVSAVLVTVFYFFTHNGWLAVILVGFMTTYMSVMGWLTMRKPEDKDI